MLRKILCAVAVLGAIPVAHAAVTGADASSQVATLQANILNGAAGAPAGDKDAVLAIITNATSGYPLDVIVRAVCPLPTAELQNVYGPDQAAIAAATATRAREEVYSALTESCGVAQAALQSYGATGGVPAGGAPGQAFGSGSVGAPGGGGGSGYTN